MGVREWKRGCLKTGRWGQREPPLLATPAGLLNRLHAGARREVPAPSGRPQAEPPPHEPTAVQLPMCMIRLARTGGVQKIEPRVKGVAELLVRLCLCVLLAPRHRTQAAGGHLG
jgi:hypothetical protein